MCVSAPSSKIVNLRIIQNHPDSFTDAIPLIQQNNSSITDLTKGRGTSHRLVSLSLVIYCILFTQSVCLCLTRSVLLSICPSGFAPPPLCPVVSLSLISNCPPGYVLLFNHLSVTLSLSLSLPCRQPPTDLRLDQHLCVGTPLSPCTMCFHLSNRVSVLLYELPPNPVT